MDQFSAGDDPEIDTLTRIGGRCQHDFRPMASPFAPPLQRTASCLGRPAKAVECACEGAAPEMNTFVLSPGSRSGSLHTMLLPSDSGGVVTPPPSSASPTTARSRPPRVGAGVAALELRGRRAAALLVAIASLALLAVAAWLTPSASGIGTHHQLGLPACGWMTSAGVPCPTCGMTTAFAAAADGDLLASFRAQPFGCLLAIATAATAVVAGFVAMTGSAVGGHLVRAVTPRIGWCILAFAMTAWLYKIAVVRGFLP